MNDSARTAWVITAAAVVVLVVLSLWAGAAPTSDAYVAFQYARNVADGHGLVANPGERPSEGYDNLLWVLAAAALRRIGLDPPAAAPFLSLLLGVACVVTLSSLLRRRAGRPAEWIVPLFALAASGPFVIASMSLSGLTSFAFLLLLAAWSLDRIGSGGGAVHGVILVLAVALAVVARFEGIVVAAAAAVVVLAMTRSGAVTRRFGFTTAGAVVTAVLCYHVWRFSVFGRFLPDSVILDAGLNRAFFVPTQPFDVAPFGAYYVAVALITVAAFVRSPRRGAACNRFAVAVAGILGLYYLFVADAVPGLGHHSALLGLALLTWPVAVRCCWWVSFPNCD
jgi:arabinofuranosyltransferase